MSVNQARRGLSARLQAIYTEREAATIAAWVTEYVTGKTRTQLLADPAVSFTESQAAEFERCAAELMTHKPVQYVLHEAWFGGMKFFVNESVLIPRPETEELVEWIAAESRNKKTLLDIGTGSGCIPVTLKKILQAAAVTSVDISADALAVAEANAKTLGADLTLIEMDFLDRGQWPALGLFDVIVSNPPYIALGEKNGMEKNVTDFEPHTALFVPDEDPLVFYRAIAEFGQTHLTAEGRMYMELNEALGSACTGLFREHGYETELRKDLQGKERMLKAWR